MHLGIGLPIGGSGFAAGVPSVMSFGQGMVLWLDSDYSGGVADGSTAPAPVNRATGSNAVCAVAAGGAGQITYRATGWRGQSCWHHVDKAFRCTGSDIVNTAAGTGKTWTRIHVMVPRQTSTTAPGTQLWVGGWDLLASGFPSNACGMVINKNDRYAYGATSLAAETVVDTAPTNQNAQILEVMRDTATTIRFGINKVRTAAATYGSGVNYAPDGMSIGGWAGGGIVNCTSDMYTRAVLVWNRALTDAERDAVYAYLTTVYAGFENIASLGATATETLVFLGIGQSVEVGSQDSLILNTYSSLSDVWLQPFNGITRPFTENAYDSTLQCTGAINHASPDISGQSSYGAMAAQLRALGITSRILFAPAAVGSTSATQWNTGHADAPPTYANIYGGARHALREAMKAPNAVLGGILINQGEADAQIDAATGTAWGGKWDTICTDLLAYAAAQGWTWKKTKRFFFTRLQLASTLAFRSQLWAAQDLLCGTTRSDCVLTQMPDASPVSIHPQADKQITHGTNRGTAWNAAA